VIRTILARGNNVKLVVKIESINAKGIAKLAIGRTTYKLASTKIESENTQARMSGNFGFFFFYLFDKRGI
jgi:hypothetical protein